MGRYQTWTGHRICHQLVSDRMCIAQSVSSRRLQMILDSSATSSLDESQWPDCELTPKASSLRTRKRMLKQHLQLVLLCLRLRSPPQMTESWLVHSLLSDLESLLLRSTGLLWLSQTLWRTSLHPKWWHPERLARTRLISRMGCWNQAAKVIYCSYRGLAPIQISRSQQSSPLLDWLWALKHSFVNLSGLLDPLRGWGFLCQLRWSHPKSQSWPSPFLR